MTSNADASCPECGAMEPNWNAGKADPDREAMRRALVEAGADIERLRTAIKKAMPNIRTGPAFAESLLKDALEQKEGGK